MGKLLRHGTHLSTWMHPSTCSQAKHVWMQAIPGWTRIFKSTSIRGSSGGKTLTGYRNNVTGQVVDRYDKTMSTVKLTLKAVTSETSATPADGATTDDRAPPTADSVPTADARAPPTADSAPTAYGRAVPGLEADWVCARACQTSISGSASPQLLVSTRAKSGYKYVIYDPRDAARSKPWSINHPLYRSAGFETPLAAATHLSESGILTQDAEQQTSNTHSNMSSDDLPRADSPIDRTTLPPDAGIISLDDAFDLSTDVKIIISFNTTTHAGLVMPRILRASAGAGTLLRRLGVTDLYADLSPMYDAIDKYNMGLIQRDAALLRIKGLFITTTSINGLPLTVTGVRTTTADRYLLTVSESSTGGVVLDDSFESMSTAQCVIVIAPLDPPVPVLTRATAAWAALYETGDALVSLHDVSFLASLLGSVRFDDLRAHFTEMQETGQQKPFYLSINGKWIVNRSTLLNATTFLISCDDVTPTLGTMMLLMRVDKAEDGAIRPTIEKVSPGVMAFGARRNVDFSSINSLFCTLHPHERPLFDADMKKLYDDGEFVRLNAHLNMIATGRRTLVPFLFTITLAELNPEALVGDDQFKTSDEAMALLAFTSIDAIRVMTVSAGYIKLFGIDDSEHLLEASCLQDNPALKHATLMCARDGSVSPQETRIGACTYSARVNVLRMGVLMLTLNDVTANANTAASFKKREDDLDRRELTMRRWMTDVTEQRERLREREENLRTLHASAFKRYRRTPGSPGSSRSASSVASSSSVSSSVSIGPVSSLVKVEEEDSVPASNHSSSFETALAGIEAFPLVTPNDKCKVYLLQSVIAIRARASSAGAEAIAQLGAFMLTTVSDEALSFFQRIDRVAFDFEIRAILVMPQAGIKLMYLFGTEHSTSPIGASVRAFLRSYIYQSADDAFWDRMLGDKSLSFVLVDGNDSIVAVQTVKIAHTICDEPIFYVALVAQSDHASSEEGNGIEKPSKFLASELTNFAYSCVPVNRVVHVVCQSVGYRYANHAGVIHVNKSVLGERGRHYWAKHGKPTEQAMLIGAQLALLPNFAEGDCLFLHKELRHLGSMPSLMQTALTEAATVGMDANRMLDNGSFEVSSSLQDLLVTEQSRHDY